MQKTEDRPSSQPLNSRPGALEWLSLAIMFALSFSVFYALMQRPSSDISIHATWASEASFLEPTSFARHVAHPMWHALVMLLRLTGLPLAICASVVTALCKTGELMLIRRLLSRELGNGFPRAAATALAFGLTLVSCLLIPGYNPNVYYGVGTPNTWHSPTQLLCMVWMLPGVCYTAKCYDLFETQLKTEGENANIPWRNALTLGALMLMSLPAKPTFMQAFLPAAAVFFGVQWIKHPANSRFFLRVLVCVLPSVLVMAAQYLYYFVLFDAGNGVTVAFTPQKLWDTLLRVLLMQAFPLYALLVCRGRARRDTLYWLTLLFSAVSIVEFLLLGETGQRASDGNFGWGMMGAMLMLWVVATLRCVYCAREDWYRRKSRRGLYLAGGALAAWHLASGIYYIIYLLTTNNAL